jgi:hypothetical protein
MTWLRILLLIYFSCQNLLYNCFVKHAKSSLQFLISILIYRMICLWIFGMDFHITYEEFFVIDTSYDLKFVTDIPYDRNEYANISCPDALVTPHFPIPTCEHRKETHVKQSRHLSTATHAYYCCSYKSVSNNIPHVWILCNLTLTSFFSCLSSIGVHSFSGLMDPRRSIHKFFFSRMIGMSLLHCALTTVGFLCHQIYRQW